MPIIRNFANPQLELLRLLREAAEVEHMLMVQYLYAGFSLKPRYRALSGEGDANASSFLGVAIRNAATSAVSTGCLWHSAAHPTSDARALSLTDLTSIHFHSLSSPLCQHSLAKYVYTEQRLRP